MLEVSLLVLLGSQEGLTGAGHAVSLLTCWGAAGWRPQVLITQASPQASRRSSQDGSWLPQKERPKRK